MEKVKNKGDLEYWMIQVVSWNTIYTDIIHKDNFLPLQILCS